jgi:hypothetical protein
MLWAVLKKERQNWGTEHPFFFSQILNITYRQSGPPQMTLHGVEHSLSQIIRLLFTYFNPVT